MVVRGTPSRREQERVWLCAPCPQPCPLSPQAAGWELVFDSRGPALRLGMWGPPRPGVRPGGRA